MLHPLLNFLHLYSFLAHFFSLLSRKSRVACEVDVDCTNQWLQSNNTDWYKISFENKALNTQTKQKWFCCFPLSGFFMHNGDLQRGFH